MNAVIDTSMSDHVLVIAQDIFTAMIDGEPGGLVPGHVPVSELVDPWHAWVDVRGDVAARAVVTAERGTCDAIARALLSMPDGEDVDRGDLVDAFGEIANVVGGNLKSLIPDSGALTLPQVAPEAPATDGVRAHEVQLSWRGSPVVISLWNLNGTEGE